MTAACDAVGLSRATAYRHLYPKAGPQRKRGPRKAHRRIPDEERQNILSVLDSDENVDQPPREVYGKLLSAGIYLCSLRTMYRVLAERAPIKDRRNHRTPQRHAVPRLTATAPNQVWSWDVSKLATFVRGTFLNLYVILDMYSRYVVAWMISERENSALAQQLFREAIGRYGIEPKTLTVHQDRGAPMTSHGFAELLGTLGVERTYSRPRVSNDNAFSESLFHTVKYQPDYPGRFKDVHHARRWAGAFFGWYNEKHHHDGLALYTPEQVFKGQVEDILMRRQQALDDAFARNPERFVKGRPIALRPPVRVELNPIDAAPQTADTVLRLDDEQAAVFWTPPPPSGPPVIVLPGAEAPSQP